MRLASVTETNILVGAAYYEEDKGNISQVGYKSEDSTAVSYGGVSEEIIKTTCADGSGAAIPCEAEIFSFRYVTGRATDDKEGFSVILTDPANPTTRFAPFDRLNLRVISDVSGVVREDREFYLTKQTDPGGEDYYRHEPAGIAKDQLMGNILLNNINNQILVEIKAYYL